jgi:hypothetical protein
LGSLASHSEVAQNDTFGVLKLTLHPASYDWQFVPEAGKTFSDAGSENCHGLIGPPPAPAAAPDGTAPVITGLRLAPRPVRGKSAFRYKLSEAAKVKFTIKRKVKGNRYRSVGEFSQLASAGANRRRFRAKIRARRLRPGRFEARLRAVDGSGNRSAPKTIGFRVVRRAR